MTGIEELGIGRFEAKIGMENTASIDMFQCRLGFVETSRSQVFSEVTFHLLASHTATAQLFKEQVVHYTLVNHP